MRLRYEKKIYYPQAENVPQTGETLKYMLENNNFIKREDNVIKTWLNQLKNTKKQEKYVKVLKHELHTSYKGIMTFKQLARMKKLDAQIRRDNPDMFKV
jgi:hypothetical protein